jgi:ribonuclease-3 family protein
LIPYLTESEQEIVKRGRNAATKPPRRLSAKVYQQATSLETLIGYLFLSDKDRLQSLLLSLEENQTPTNNS